MWALPAARAFRFKSSPFLRAIHIRTVGFTLQSLTHPTHTPNTISIPAKINYIYI